MPRASQVKETQRATIWPARSSHRAEVIRYGSRRLFDLGAACMMKDSMESYCLPFSEIPHTTRLFSSFLDDFGQVGRYFSHAPTREGVAAAAKKIAYDAGVRKQVADVLREQNARFSATGAADAATERNLERFAHGAAAIVTGQQAGLFSGPALTFYKAISAVRWAEELTRTGVEAVPVFWLATEDHDLAEVNQSFWNTAKGLQRYALAAGESAGGSVGGVALGESVRGATAQAEEALTALNGPFAGETARALRESYAPGETWGSAFGKLLARLLAGRGILFLDPMDERLDRLAAAVYLRAVASAAPLRELLLGRSKELEERGFHAQVKVTSETTLLFRSVNGPATAGGRREAVRQRGEGFAAGEQAFTREALRAAIQNEPGRFTPNALLRPVVQDTLLPTAAYIGGPAEIAYLAQAEAAYRELGVRMPAIVPRASFTVVEPVAARVLEKYGLDIRDVLRGRQHVRAQMERKSAPPGLMRRFEADEASLKAIFAGYDEIFGQLDPTLIPALRGAERKAVYQLTALRAKAGRAENFRTGVLDRHEAALMDALYPHHELQERSLCALPWLAAYGAGILDALAARYEIPASGGAATAGVAKGPATLGARAPESAAAPAPARIGPSSCVHRHQVVFL